MALSASNRLAAWQQIANLGKRYPASAHVALTRTLLEADALLRQEHGSVRGLRSRFAAVVELDAGYLPSQHWLCAARMAACCRWELLDLPGREQFVDTHLTSLMGTLAQHRYDLLGDYALSHQHDLLIDGWRAVCHEAVVDYAAAVVHIDSSRYTPEHRAAYVRTAQTLSAGTDVIRARTAITRWLEIWLPRVNEGFAPETWPARYA